METLTKLNSTFLMLASGKQNNKTLWEDWSRMLEIHPIFCDLWSNVSIAKGKLQESLEVLDKRGDLPYGQPAPTLSRDRFVILFTEKFFKEPIKRRIAIALHELGHFYVYQTGMLKNLRAKWTDGLSLFNVFVSNVRQDSKWYSSNKEWLRGFYEFYVFDILKVPGEIYANLWVKDNFGDAFDLVVECQLENYKFLAENIDKNIRTKVIIFPCFCIMTRLEGLSILLDRNTKETREKLLDVQRLYREKAVQYHLNEELEALESTKERIIQICQSPETSDKNLYGFFEGFLADHILKPTDFV